MNRMNKHAIQTLIVYIKIISTRPVMQNTQNKDIDKQNMYYIAVLSTVYIS